MVTHRVYIAASALLRSRRPVHSILHTLDWIILRPAHSIRLSRTPTRKLSAPVDVHHLDPSASLRIQLTGFKSVYLGTIVKSRTASHLSDSSQIMRLDLSR